MRKKEFKKTFTFSLDDAFEAALLKIRIANGACGKSAAIRLAVAQIAKSLPPVEAGK